MAGIHHVEIWLDELEAVRREWGWLLQCVGFRVSPDWDYGVAYEANGAYLTFTTSPNLSSHWPTARRTLGGNRANSSTGCRVWPRSPRDARRACPGLGSRVVRRCRRAIRLFTPSEVAL
jgi:hypothetical protein